MTTHKPTHHTSHNPTHHVPQTLARRNARKRLNPHVAVGQRACLSHTKFPSRLHSTSCTPPCTPPLALLLLHFSFCTSPFALLLLHFLAFSFCILLLLSSFCISPANFLQKSCTKSAFLLLLSSFCISPAEILQKSCTISVSLFADRLHAGSLHSVCFLPKEIFEIKLP